MATKRLLLRAAIAEVPVLALKAMTAALEEYEILVVSEARNLAPVRQAFKDSRKKRTKSLAGTYLDAGVTGRGARRIVKSHHRNSGAQLLNRRARHGDPKHHSRARKDIIVGSVTHKGSRTSGEITSFKPHLQGTTTFKTQVGTAAARTGHGTRARYAQGYAFGGALQSALTSRARYNLARGIGTHEVGGQIILGGALRDSIHGQGVEATDGGLQVYITADVRYAKYVEYGTYKDYAQPFMRPAIKNSKRKLGPLLKKHLQDTGFTAKG